VTWQPGRDRIGELLDAKELEQVTADERIARLLLDDASRHLATAASALSSEDLSGAHQLAYDALRKSAASLRATSRGGHVAVQEAVLAQFGLTVRAFRSFGRIRGARNNFEYPSTVTPGPSADDVTDAIATATQIHHAATTILEHRPGAVSHELAMAELLGGS